MASRLLLVRHARVEARYAGRLLGATDAPLSAEGRAQAALLAPRIAGLGASRLLASPMLRCRETAQAIAHGLPIEWDDDLREIDFGHWENLTFAEAAAGDPATVERWAAFAPDFAFPGGERVGDFLARVRRAADRLSQCEDETVLAVTHGGVIRTMTCHLLGLEPRNYVAFEVGYAAVVEIRLFEGKGVLASLVPCEFATQAANALAEVAHG